MQDMPPNFLNGLQIGLQAIVSGLIAAIFMCIYMFCISIILLQPSFYYVPKDT